MSSCTPNYYEFDKNGKTGDILCKKNDTILGEAPIFNITDKFSNIIGKGNRLDEIKCNTYDPLKCNTSNLYNTDDFKIASHEHQYYPNQLYMKNKWIVNNLIKQNLNTISRTNAPIFRTLKFGGKRRSRSRRCKRCRYKSKR